MHALIIEDEAAIAMTIEDMLLAMGFETADMAATEADAVTLALARRPDLITADICLLEGTGVSAVLRIREAMDHPERLLVVFVTGNPDLAQGMPDPVLEKPFAFSQLEHAIAAMGLRR
jgi:DNA-binding response OmpR family regulator